MRAWVVFLGAALSGCANHQDSCETRSVSRSLAADERSCEAICEIARTSTASKMGGTAALDTCEIKGAAVLCVFDVTTCN